MKLVDSLATFLGSHVFLTYKFNEEYIKKQAVALLAEAVEYASEHYYNEPFQDAVYFALLQNLRQIMTKEDFEVHCTYETILGCKFQANN